MIVLDTSVLIDSLSGQGTSKSLRLLIEKGERILLPTVVLYEWLRGPRTAAELAAQEALFPAAGAIVFGPREAELSAQIYRSLRRARGREMDIAIAACAILKEAALWTLNASDFTDIPALRLAGLD